MNLFVPHVWINGVLTFRSQSATEPQVGLAVRETFRRLVRPEEVRVSGVTALATTSTASMASTTWRAAFGVGEATAAADTARATLQALAERVAAARAAAFTAELENQLMDAGRHGPWKMVEDGGSAVWVADGCCMLFVVLVEWESP